MLLRLGLLKCPDEALEAQELHVSSAAEQEKAWCLHDLGEGNFGKVYHAREKKSKLIVTLKVLHKNTVAWNEGCKEMIRSLHHEIKIQTAYDHKSILKLYGYFYDPQHVYLIMEYLGGQELYKLMCTGLVDPENIKHIFNQVAAALKHLHGKKFVHQDLKPKCFVRTKKEESGSHQF